MNARTMARAALVALSLAAPAALPVGQASATGSPVTLSRTSASPLTRFTASVASCVDDPGHQRTLSVQLISGSGHSAKLAGRAQGWPGHPAILIVPDWVDPAAPASVEASCATLDLTNWTDSTVAYASVPFDVLPLQAAPHQAATLSRSSLKAGQGLYVAGTGCTQPDTDSAVTFGYSGGDPTGRSLGAPDTGSLASVAGGAFTTRPLFSGGSVEYDLENIGEGPAFDPQTAQITNLFEEPVTYTPGPYTVITECFHQDGSALMFRPRLVNLLANPAVSQTELDAPGPGRGVRIRGQACAAGPVRVVLEAESLQEIRDALPQPDPSESPWSRLAGRGRPGVQPDVHHRTLTAPSVPRTPLPTQRITGDLATTGYVDTTVNPSQGGAWSYVDQTGFDEGIVTGIGLCGDPYGTGFTYNYQGIHKTPNDG